MMPKPKVYREYFPTCIERFFGSGKPRRIKARCFVPYTQQEQNTDIYLGPSRDAPNIDLNMTVRKDKYGNLTASPDEGSFGNIGPSYDRSQQMWADDQSQAAGPYGPCAPCATSSPCGPCAPCAHSSPCGPCTPCSHNAQSQKLDCGCSCRCSESYSTSSRSSSTSRTKTESTTATKTKSRSRSGKPRILMLENDGRYRPLDDEFIKPRTPRKCVKKSKSKSSQTSREKPKLVVKEKKVQMDDITEDDVSIIPAECGLDIGAKEKSNNSVVVGFVMYDPESADKRPYVTTMDGKRITQHLTDPPTPKSAD